MADHIEAEFGTASIPEANLPSVTLNMLIDYLTTHGYDILKRAEKAQRIFRWFTVVSHKDADYGTAANVRTANTLFVTHIANAEELLRANPNAFALVLVDEDEDADARPQNANTAAAAAGVARGDDVPEPARDFRAAGCTVPADLSGRYVAVRQRGAFGLFAFSLQSYFTQLLIWENELDRIVMHNGSIADLLNASVPVIKNYMFLSDSNFNVVAKTERLAPPDELHRIIIENGSLTPDMIEERRKRLPEKAFYIKEPSHISPYARLSQPLYINHTYLGSLSMSCNTVPLTEGLKDLFRRLNEYILPLCESQWRNWLSLNIPHYLFFERLLDNRNVTDDYVAMQVRMAKLGDATQFKLLAFDVDEGEQPELAARVVRAATKLNRGNVFAFAYRKRVVALLWSANSESRLAHIHTVAEACEHIYQPFGVECGISEVFAHITDMHLAYKQACIALDLRNLILTGQPAPEDPANRGSFLFGDTLPYVLIDPAPKDEKFMRFCFSHTPVAVLYEEDVKNGTSYLSMFWLYLRSERNATSVANRLHMHRNTVIYHIERIQKRFGLDLGMQSARERMMLDIRMHMLTLDEESREKLTEAMCPPPPEER